MPTYRQLTIDGVSELLTVPSSGLVFEVGAGRCECGERLCVLTPSGWVAGFGAVNIWGCLDCNNWCDRGEHLTRTDDVSICSECDACSDCCECYYCESCCEMSTREPCDECYRCEDCCDCQECSRCNVRYAPDSDSYLCGECERCEDCCSCIRCAYCGEAVDSVRDCGECGSCCDHDECSGEPSDDIDEPSPRTGAVPFYDPAAYLKFGRTFGVELEHVGIGMSEAIDSLRAADLSVSGNTSYRHTDSHSEWKIVPDASVSGGQEAVSPILAGPDGFAQLTAAMGALSAYGASVNRSCGTHVHLGTDDLTAADIAAIVRFYDRHHTLIDRLHAPSRRVNRSEWCGPFNEYESERLEDRLKACDDKRSEHGIAMAGGRYRSVNLKALIAHGTIEFRQHGGTLNAEKLSAWIRFLLALVEHCKVDPSATYRTLVGEDGLLSGLSRYGLAQSDIDYLTNRAMDLATVR